MSLTFKQGDIFESTATFLVDPVNCQGRSGAGLALQFKEKFPETEEEFIARAKVNHIKMGSVSCVDAINDEGPLGRDRIIVYFPTVLQPGKFGGTIWDIYEGLVSLRQVLVTHRTDVEQRPSCALPAVGCGLNGLPWEGKGGVRAAIHRVFDRWSEGMDIEAYLPGGPNGR